MDNELGKGYVNYFEVLGVPEGANPGEVRKSYRKQMKNLVNEIASTKITADRRAHFLLEMAKLNAALYILRDQAKRDAYWSEREALLGLEVEWREKSGDTKENDRLRRAFDGKMRHFLSTYVEEAMLEAGRDKECQEASNWDAAHERHASNLLRKYRHELYHDVLERLPYYEVTQPQIDWEERKRKSRELMTEGAI